MMTKLLQTAGAARRIVYWLLAMGCASVGTALQADTLHGLADGAHEHHFTGWIFPASIGEFVRVAVPTDVDGSVDVVAEYQAQIKGVRMVAIVDVYPPDSYAQNVTLEQSRAALLQDRGASATRTEVPFKVEGERPLMGIKVSVRGKKTSEALSSLYFFDTGEWIVKVSASADRAAKGADRALDRFVRDQRWDSFQLLDDTCTGPACPPGQP